MSYLAWLVPIALGMGIAGLAAFLWSMRSGQYDDLDGAAERVLIAEGTDAPLLQEAWKEQLSAAPSSLSGNVLSVGGVLTEGVGERSNK
ncbi:cbb3-type cytochrome oxidase assembly protein CcoS [Tianweitania sediminis]|uniref:Cbb3-type cytochrome oxidase assembly protein CcoS n=1 Tax=Tianweitania sediminis TaxID=1502156 RepID=A0A8J7UK55_9HYPH|nr:cbb3-type cytochrome oxidase assembly protein CcoS [Tianweitania sediminis]MBP0438022.1 cbb3-type cytochrome oxidase assembly protein CcoS [Tianweitania sediminis]